MNFSQEWSKASGNKKGAGFFKRSVENYICLYSYDLVAGDIVHRKFTMRARKKIAHAHLESWKIKKKQLGPL